VHASSGVDSACQMKSESRLPMLPKITCRKSIVRYRERARVERSARDERQCGCPRVRDDTCNEEKRVLPQPTKDMIRVKEDT